MDLIVRTPKQVGERSALGDPFVRDIVERGIVMTGGGSLLKGFPKLIAKETGVPVILAENPLLCVALGAGKFLEHDLLFRPELLFRQDWPQHQVTQDFRGFYRRSAGHP